MHIKNIDFIENYKEFYYKFRKETINFLNFEFEKLNFSNNEKKFINYILLYLYRSYFGLYRKNQLINGYNAPAINHFIEAFKNFIYLKDNFNINYFETTIVIFLHDSIEDKIFVVPGKHPYVVFSDIRNNILNEKIDIPLCPNKRCSDLAIKHLSLINIYKFLKFLSKRCNVDINYKKILKSINCLTKDKDQTIDAYLNKVKQDEIAFVVKLCDFLDNIRGPLTDKMEKKYIKYILFYKKFLNLKNYIRPSIIDEIESEYIKLLL